jgi:hypothetical protein
MGIGVELYLAGVAAIKVRLGRVSMKAVALRPFIQFAISVVSIFSISDFPLSLFSPRQNNCEGSNSRVFHACAGESVLKYSSNN